MNKQKINWKQQWAHHACGFRDGCAHIQLPNQTEIQLLPGPGFGDFSHPTTQLMIELMPAYVEGQTVLDIGCGSGILSIAAAKLGARLIYALDIDKDACLHAQKNAIQNGATLSFELPKKFLQKPIILMNMIESEQKIAWKQYPFQTLITSGILDTQKEAYLQFAKEQNWHLLDNRKKQGWLGLIFKENR